MIQKLTFQQLNKIPFLSQLLLIALLLLCLPMMQVDAERDEATVALNWTFDDGTAIDTSNNGINGVFVGNPMSVVGIVGKGLQFDGQGDGIGIPDTPLVNTGGPYTDRTVAAFFKCSDISKNQKQVIFKAGGGGRGLNIYVHSGEVYVGGWNRSQYNWDGTWISKNIKSNRWHHVALVIRDAADALEDDKFEMWLDGKLVAKEAGGQLYKHINDTSFGYVSQKTIYHDGIEDLSDVGWFGGIIDEFIVYNSAFDATDFAAIALPLSVESEGKFTTTWGYLKDKLTEN